MLHEFIEIHRDEILSRHRSKMIGEPNVLRRDAHSVGNFLAEISETLRFSLPHTRLSNAAVGHGAASLGAGFTVDHLVREFSAVSSSIVELAVEATIALDAEELRLLHLCVENAIAASVSEYLRLREYQATERIGMLGHELRNLIATAQLAFNHVQSGSVGARGSTATILSRSLSGLSTIIERELADVRLGAGLHHRETVVVSEFLKELELTASLEANGRALRFSVTTVASDVLVHADRQVLVSVVGNLLQNAFKFTPPLGHVQLRALATADRVQIDVEDECGGLPLAKVDQLFRPFTQVGDDHTGLGLGLTICQRGARANDGEIHVCNHPGEGCVFTLDLPRQRAQASA